MFGWLCLAGFVMVGVWAFVLGPWRSVETATSPPPLPVSPPPVSEPAPPATTTTIYITTLCDVSLEVTNIIYNGARQSIQDFGSNIGRNDYESAIGNLVDAQFIVRNTLPEAEAAILEDCSPLTEEAVRTLDHLEAMYEYWDRTLKPICADQFPSIARYGGCDR